MQRSNSPHATNVDALSGPAYWRVSAQLTLASLARMGRRQGLAANLTAGVTVTLVAVPLNLALAIACGLPPSTGILSGAIAGVLGALLGGSRLQVTGPEVALAPITLEIVSRHGISGLVAATFLAGLFQIALGVCRVGGLVHAIPLPVVGGFLAAVGWLVFDAQLPRLLGLPSDVRLLSDIEGFEVLRQVNLTSLAIGLAVIAALLFLPRLLPRLPAPLVALSLAVALVQLLGGSLPTVSALSSGPALFALPDFAGTNWVAIFPEAVALAVLASIDSLLCAVSVDSLSGGERTRTDQELVAQGLANMASACCGGMPVAAAVVRSVAAIEAGASERLAPLTQSVLLALTLVVLGGIVTYVPLVALAAILLVVGARLVRWRDLRAMWKIARSEALIFVVTALSIAMTDFVFGVATGVVLALAHFARQQRALLSARKVSVATADATRTGSAHVLRLEGPLFFASQTDVETALRELDAPEHVVVDVSNVSTVDVSGATALINALRGLTRRGTRVSVSSPGRPLEPALEWVRQSFSQPTSERG
jgi:SulP family sulfate permease